MATQIFSTKTGFFCFILISSFIFYLLAIPSSQPVFSLLAFSFLLMNIFAAPALVRSGIIQTGYRKISPLLIWLLLLIYLVGMYNFSKAWLENIQHLLWNLIIDNLTNFFAAVFILFYLLILMGYYVIYQRSTARTNGR